MVLTCPQCSTRYHVDPASMDEEGRRVRCAECGHRWVAKPPADLPKVVEFGGPGATPAPLLRPGAAAPKPSRRTSASLVGWLVGVLVLLLAASAVIGRDEIVAGFPASASIYQKLGLAVTVQLGLQFESVTSKRVEQGGIAVLVVEGKIINKSPGDRKVPPIRVTLLDEGGRQLQEELFEAKEGELPSGAETSFSGRMVNPAERARNFSVTFEIDS